MATAPADLAPIQREGADEQFRHDVLVGLSQAQKTVPARWFYDHRGSELFDEITRLPEYYPTRTETTILQASAKRFGELSGRRPLVIVEFGAGSITKTPLLLDAIPTAAYVPVDISGAYLAEACAALAVRYPNLPIHAVEADFGDPVQLPANLALHPRLGFFPGSTIGNMEPFAATDLLRSMRRTLGHKGQLLIGFDRVKAQEALIAAYDDAQGVTAAFNLNLLVRINRELEGSIPVECFRHRAIWNPKRARIEMHLAAIRDLSFEVNGQVFTMVSGETIHTENSHKYEPRSAEMLLLSGGWEPIETFEDEDCRFMVMLARAIGPEQTA